MLVQEEYLDATNRYHLGSSGLYTPFTTDIGKLFQRFQKEYGKCVSHVYVDGPNEKPLSVGWVFQKRVKYDRSEETYLQEIWVSLHDEKPKQTIQYNYHYLKGKL